MFDWLKRIQAGASSAEEVVQYFEQMLEDGRHVFDLAANALLGGTAPDVVKNDIWETDKRINRNERRIRRRIVTHLTTHGGAGATAHLVLMSLVKDAERIGDYGKNLFDLALLERRMPEDAYPDLLGLREQLSRNLAKARNIYSSEDEAAARDFVATAEAFSKHCDRRTEVMVLRDDTDSRSAAGALAYRYFKRINAHAMNIITSVLVPVDRLDYWDEDEGGRGPAPSQAD
jgi:Na+/phosphate symporter